MKALTITLFFLTEFVLVLMESINPSSIEFVDESIYCYYYLCDRLTNQTEPFNNPTVLQGHHNEPTQRVVNPPLFLSS